MERIEIGTVSDAARQFCTDAGFIWYLICSPNATVRDSQGEWQLHADRRYPDTQTWIVEAVKVG